MFFLDVHRCSIVNVRRPHQTDSMHPRHLDISLHIHSRRSEISKYSHLSEIDWNAYWSHQSLSSTRESLADLRTSPSSLQRSTIPIELSSDSSPSTETHQTSVKSWTAQYLFGDVSDGIATRLSQLRASTYRDQCQRQRRNPERVIASRSSLGQVQLYIPR